MKKLLPIVVFFALLTSCGNERPTGGNDTGSANSTENASERVDDGKGIGQVKEVTLNTPLEQERVKRGLAIYEMKCQACHRLDDKRVVGPGFKDVTKRRKPEWIMNMITNVEMMLEQDEEARKLLELCLTRMPNQNVSIGDARDVLEYMRQNDGEQ
jgi:mono/diheme cytochrome c family protein